MLTLVPTVPPGPKGGFFSVVPKLDPSAVGVPEMIMIAHTSVTDPKVRIDRAVDPRGDRGAGLGKLSKSILRDGTHEAREQPT
jgi:hypothetical protein